MLKLKNFSKKRNNYLAAYLFVLPATLLLVVFIVYPAMQGLYLSFFRWDGISEKIFLGFKNYIEVFQDSNFFLALKNTLIYALISNLFIIVLGFTLAVIIDNKVKGWKFYRFVFFLPTMLSYVVVALLWQRIFEPRNGIINNFLGLLHLDFLKQQWLGDPKLALYCLILVVIWQWSGLFMVFFLAAMQNIDETIYEAAKIDGVSTLGRVFKVTLPIIKDQFIIIVILLTIASMKVFDIVWVATQGGPGGTTHVLGTYLYMTAFRFRRVGYASVIAVLTFVVSIIFGFIYINYDKFSRKKIK